MFALKPEASSLFVGGCFSSGTSILTSILNAHPEILVTIERFQGEVQNHRTEKIFPLKFTRKQVIADIKAGQFPYKTYPNPNEFGAPNDEDTIAFLKKAKTVKYIGDKVPFYSSMGDRLLTEFKNPKFIFISRNPYNAVASSQARMRSSEGWKVTPEKCLTSWNVLHNQMLELAKKFPEQTLTISYERLLSFSPAYLRNIFGFLEVDKQNALAFDFYRSSCDRWQSQFIKHNVSNKLREYVGKNANFDVQRDLFELNEFAA